MDANIEHIIKRGAALKWWKGLSMEDKTNYCNSWQNWLPMFDFRKKWDQQMLFASTSCIVAIYEYMNHEQL